MYRIEIEAEADKALRRMPRNTAKRIQSKLLALAADPLARQPNVKTLTGREAIDCVSAAGGRFTPSIRMPR